MLSITVTPAVQVDTLPFTSVTVRVIVFGLVATSAHVKSASERTKEAIPHASDEPLFTNAAVVEPRPFTSKVTFTF